MTKREAAIVSAYTDVLIGDFRELHNYLVEKSNRWVPVHELPEVRIMLLHEIRKDFCAIKIEG